MYYSISGKLVNRKENFVVVETGGIGYKIFIGSRTAAALPELNKDIKLFCGFYVREDRQDLYGFFTEEELRLFELFNAVPGIGPKSALELLTIGKPENLIAAIIENRPDILTRVSGIGRKTADRIILELKSKVKLPEAGKLTKQLDIDSEIEAALVNLGYQRNEVKEVLDKMPGDHVNLEERLKTALKFLSKK